MMKIGICGNPISHSKINEIINELNKDASHPNYFSAIIPMEEVFDLSIPEIPKEISGVLLNCSLDKAFTAAVPNSQDKLEKEFG